MKLDEKQISFISSMIESSAIKSQEMRDNLLDHYCCHIEQSLSKGLSFDQALQLANEEIAPSGLNGIQLETQTLLNFNIMINVRRIMYISGFIFSTMLLTGIFFRLMHFPYATVLMFSGLFGVSWIFLPILTYLKLKVNPPRRTFGKVSWIAGLISLSLFALASLFKLLHLMGADIVLALSFLTFILLFLPFTFFEMYKQSVERIKA